MDKPSGKNEGFLTGFLLGGLIGAGVALVLGGEDKEKIKKIFREKGKMVFEGLEEAFKEGKNRIEDKVEEVKDEVGEKVEKEIKSLKAVAFPNHRFFTKKGRKLSSS